MVQGMKWALKPSVGSSFGWTIAGTGGQVFFQVLALVVLSRLLSPAEFGVVSAAAIVAQLSMILNEFGIGPALVQRNSLNDDDIQVGFTLSCFSGIVVVLGLWLSAPLIAVMFQIPELKWVIRAYTVSFVAKSFSTVAESLLQRQLQFRLLARSDAISFALGYAGVGIACAASGLSYWSLVLAHLCQSAIKAGLIVRYASHPKRLLLQIDKVKEFLRFGIGQSISRFGSFVASQGDSFIVAKLLGVERLGEYGRANQLVTIPANQLGSVFDKVLFPTFALVQNEKERFRAAYSKAITIIAMLGLPASVLLFAVAQDLALVTLGDSWSNVIAPMEVLSLGLFFRLLHKISDPTARAAGAVYQRAWRQVVVAITLLGGTYLGATFGLVGVAYGVLVATALDAALMVQLCSRIAELNAKSIFLALSPGIRLGMATGIVAFCSRYFSSLVTESNFGMLVMTVLMVFTAIGFFIYAIPKISMGRVGVDVIEYVWSVLDLEKWLGLKAPIL